MSYESPEEVLTKQLTGALEQNKRYRATIKAQCEKLARIRKGELDLTVEAQLAALYPKKRLFKR